MRQTSASSHLGKIDNRPFDFEKYPRGENNFTFKLPYSGTIITIKLLTKKDENLIDQELTGFAKVSKDFTKEITTRLTHFITSVNENTEKATIRKFVNEELQARDSLALRNYIRDMMPDINTEFDFSCAHCNLERKEETPLGVSFFWPNGRV